MNRRDALKYTAALTATASLPFKVLAQQSKMRSRPIPGTNEYLPVIGLGAPAEFVNMPPEGKDLPISLVNAMIEMGGSVMHTPAFFRPNPPIIGDIINEMGVKDDLFLISKSTVNGKEASQKHLEIAVDNLNKRPIAALLLHNMRQLDIQWPMLKDWKEKGLVRYIGVSMVPRTARFEAYEKIEKFMNEESPEIIMTGYSMTQPWPGDRITPLAMDKGIAVIVAEAFKALEDGAYFAITAGKKIPEWLEEYNINSWAQFSLKWIISDPAITSVVTETGKVSHVLDNMEAGFGKLPDQQTRVRMRELLYSFI